jgi:hypothetical protein
LFFQLCFQPGSTGQIVSLRAVGDGDFHGAFPFTLCIHGLGDMRGLPFLYHDGLQDNSMDCPLKLLCLQEEKSAMGKKYLSGVSGALPAAVPAI